MPAPGDFPHQAVISAIKATAKTSDIFCRADIGMFKINYCEENGFMCSDENSHMQRYFQYGDITLRDTFYKLVKNHITVFA